MSEQTYQELTQSLDNLNNLCELLHVSVHRTRMIFKIKGVEVKVAGQLLTEKQATRSSWKLMPEAMEREINSIDSRVQSLLSQYTVGFKSHSRGAELHDYQIRGIYLVPIDFVETLLTELNNLHDELQAVVTAWTSDEDRFYEGVRMRFDDPQIYNLAKERIPTVSKLLETTRIDVVSIPFGMNQDKFREVGASSLLRQTRERTNEMVQKITENLFMVPRQELADAINKLERSIRDNKKLRHASLNEIKAAVEKLNMFSFVGDDALTQRIDGLMRHLDGINPSEQTVQEAETNGLLTMLRETAEEAVNTANIQERINAGVSRRRISSRGNFNR